MYYLIELLAVYSETCFTIFPKHKEKQSPTLQILFQSRSLDPIVLYCPTTNKY